MDDRHREVPARLQDPRGFGDGLGHLVDVLHRHERDREVGDVLAQRQVRDIGVNDRAAATAVRACERGRALDLDDPVAPGSERASDAALARAEIDGQPGRRG